MMKKLEKLKNEIGIVNFLHTIKGGTSTTMYQETGVAEMEYKDQDKDGKKDDPNDQGVIVDLPI